MGTNIAFFPDGELDGALAEVLSVVCTKALGADAFGPRAIRLPISVQDITSPDGRPPEELMIERFIKYAKPIFRPDDALQPVVFLRYRNEGSFLQAIAALCQGLPYLRVQTVSPEETEKTGIPSTTHVLLLRSAEEAYVFMKEWANLGTLSGDLHKGAVLHTTIGLGRWFVVTWSPTMPNEELGRSLRSELDKAMLDDEAYVRISSNPPPAPELPRSSRRNPPRSHQSGMMPAVTLPASTGLADRIQGILGVSRDEPKKNLDPNSDPPDRS